MDKVSVQRDLSELSSQVGDIDQRAAQRLQELRNALDNMTQAKTWAGMDLYLVISPDSIAGQYEELYRSQRGGPGLFIKFLEGLRNVSIFLPIMITWYGVSQATSAYHQLLSQCLKSCPDQVQQPFLYLWEQGFGGGLPNIFRLSNIGLIDAAILALIFAATLYISIVSGNSNRQAEIAEQNIHGQALALRSRLSNVLADTTFLLRSQSSLIVSPVDKLDDIARAIVQMSQDILGQFNLLKDSFTTVADEMKHQFTTTQNATQEMLRQIGTISSMIGAFQLAIDQFKTAGETVSDRLAALVQPIERLTTDQQKLLDRVNESADHLKDSADHLDSLRNDQKDWGEKIANTLEQQEDVLGNFDTIIQTLSALEGQLTHFLSKLGEERDAQEQQALQIAAASDSFREALDYTRDEATQIRSIAVDMGDFVNMLARLSSSSSMNVAGIVAGYEQAAQTIDQGASALGETATIIFDAAQELKSAVTAFKAAIP
ncbi:MAG TPA: hypothetical protein VFV38_14380 [Ktedonobacteraceae bacterium]|nr:hypothetical protein [Ktedonobacteraceae bacterium]